MYKEFTVLQCICCASGMWFSTDGFLCIHKSRAFWACKASLITCLTFMLRLLIFQIFISKLNSVNAVFISTVVINLFSGWCKVILKMPWYMNSELGWWSGITDREERLWETKNQTGQHGTCRIYCIFNKHDCCRFHQFPVRIFGDILYFQRMWMIVFRIYHCYFYMFFTLCKHCMFLH